MHMAKKTKKKLKFKYQNQKEEHVNMKLFCPKKIKLNMKYFLSALDSSVYGDVYGTSYLSFWILLLCYEQVMVCVFVNDLLCLGCYGLYLRSLINHFGYKNIFERDWFHTTIFLKYLRLVYYTKYHWGRVFFFQGDFSSV